MNLATINQIRAGMGLAPLAANPGKQAQKKRQAANAAARAEANREIRGKRSLPSFLRLLAQKKQNSGRK